MIHMKPKLQVVHFQRRPRHNANFSLEFIFDDVRQRLSSSIDFKVDLARYESNGFVRRLLNAVFAARAQGVINHVTGDIHYVNAFFRKSRSILTILDCGPMNSNIWYKRFIFKLFWLYLPVRKAKCITTISQASKSDIVRYAKCDPDKVVVIPVAVSELFRPFAKEFNTDCPVLLQLGTAPNKNLERLIPALENIPCKLVIVGQLNEEHKRLLTLHGIQFENKFNLSQQEVIDEYTKCDILTFISTFEGFGMPIIEANWVERPVIAGNNSSMIDVAKDAAFLVDASDVSDIRNGILRLISDKDLREDLIDKGRSNRMRFSGEHIAEMYYDVYEKVFNEIAN